MRSSNALRAAIVATLTATIAPAPAMAFNVPPHRHGFEAMSVNAPRQPDCYVFKPVDKPTPKLTSDYVFRPVDKPTPKLMQDADC
jgi:hypothetical protein